MQIIVPMGSHYNEINETAHKKTLYLTVRVSQYQPAEGKQSIQHGFGLNTELCSIPFFH